MGIYGRKKRQVLESDGLVTYPNGARAPFDPNVALATANHYAAKAVTNPFFLEGSANVHPPAVAPAAYPVAPFVAHPNGAVVPLEPKDVVDARKEHLDAVAEALKPAEK